VDLYSVDWNKMDSHYLITAGGDPFIRLYDRRNMTEYVKKFHPHQNIRSSAHVTGIIYSDDGKQFLGSYSGDTVYLFDVNSSVTPENLTNSPPTTPPSSSSSSSSTTSHSEGTHNESPYFVRKYQGHCNVRTVKEVNFLGSSCEYIVSGSDDGRIFIWDRFTSEILNILKGDKHVVNITSGHPFDGVVMATSGIENNVKIWEPIAEGPTILSDVYIEQIMEENRNQSERRARGNLIPWTIIEHIMNRAEVGPGTRVNVSVDDDDDENNEYENEGGENDDDSEGEGGRQIRCAFQ